MMQYRHSTRLVRLILPTTMLLVAAACGSPSHAPAAIGTDTTESTTTPPSASRMRFPIVQAKVIGRTTPDAISALAAHGDSVWLAVDDAILESTDDGEHWRQVSTVDGVNSLSFTSETDGWAATTTGLLRTTDGGVSWVRVQTAGPDYFYRVRFATAQYGWTIGQDGFERTADGGLSWTGVLDPCGLPRMGALFAFVSPSDGWLLCRGVKSTGAEQRVLYDSTDGGLTWRRFSSTAFGSDATPPSTYMLPDSGYADDLFFLDADQGWIAGKRQTLESTADGARTWHYGTRPMDEPEDDSGAVTFTSPSHGYFVGLAAAGAGSVGHAVYATSDGGSTWSSMYELDDATASISNGILTAITFGGREEQWSALLPGFAVRAAAVHGSDIWVVATRCGQTSLPPGKSVNLGEYRDCELQPTLLSSNDRGHSWIQYELPGVDVQDVFVTTTGVLCVDDGHAVFGSDDGRTWTRVEPALIPANEVATPVPSG